MESGQSRAVVPTYLGWSIFNTLCCCLPLGIAAIICSRKAQDANDAGDQVNAAEASRTAKILNVVGLVCGIILFVIFIALFVTGAPYYWGPNTWDRWPTNVMVPFLLGLCSTITMRPPNTGYILQRSTSIPISSFTTYYFSQTSLPYSQLYWVCVCGCVPHTQIIL